MNAMRIANLDTRAIVRAMHAEVSKALGPLWTDILMDFTPIALDSAVILSVSARYNGKVLRRTVNISDYELIAEHNDRQVQRVVEALLAAAKELGQTFRPAASFIKA